MTIYARSDQLSVGKDIPALGPFKNFKPNLVGPVGGKLKVAIKIAQAAASGEGISGLLAGTILGTGVALVDEILQKKDDISDKQRKTFRSSYNYRLSFGQRQRTDHHKHYRQRRY